MRFYIIWAVFLFFCLYSWKNWYRSACFLVFSMSIFETPWMPKAAMGIPGLNPWNLLLVCSCAAAYFMPSLARPQLDSKLRWLIGLYASIVFLAFLRELGDMSGIIEFARYQRKIPITERGILQEDLLNTFKYVGPAILIYLGCDSTARFREAIYAVLAMNLVLSLLVIKSMGLSALSSGFDLNDTAIRRIDRDVGYFRSDLAILFAGGAWALFAARDLFKSSTLRLAATIASGIAAIAMGITGGRMGMVGWAAIGGMVSFLRYRRLLLLAPIAVFVVLTQVPAIADRLSQGFSYDPNDSHYQKYDSDIDINSASVTSGRTVIWPEVIRKIGDAPLFGYGRRAMQRIGLSIYLGEEYGEPFPHPHNAYLQLLLDNGIILAIPILLFFWVVVRRSLDMLKQGLTEYQQFAGLFSLIYVVSFLLGCITQQSFYPYAGSVSMWVAIAIMLRSWGSMRSGLNGFILEAKGPESRHRLAR